MKKLSQKNRNQYGFTIIEMAAVIIISGMMFAAVINLYSKQISQKKYNITVENLEIVQGVINEYLGAYGRYPCPANPQLAPGDFGYGIEQCRTPAQLAIPCTPAAGAGIPPGLDCENIGARDVDGGGPEEVMSGSVPIITLSQSLTYLNFSELAAIDGYGNKFTYAVTEKMTDNSKNTNDPVLPQSGAITVIDENRRNVTVPASSAHYVLFSHGEDQLGAYSKQGGLTPIESCFTSLAFFPFHTVPAGGINPIGGGVKNDIENCDGNDAVFIKSLISTANNDNYYDDIFTYRSSSNIPIWRRSPVSGAVHLYSANQGNVGVNVNTPTEKLVVDGNVVAEMAQARNGFCDPVRADCTTPQIIGGSPATLTNRCALGQVARRIQNNTLECDDIFSGGALPTMNALCPAQDTGDIDGDGDSTEPLFATGLRMDFSTNTLTFIDCLPI